MRIHNKIFTFISTYLQKTILIFCVIFITLPSASFGLAQGTQKAIQYDSVFYDPQPVSCAASGATIALTGTGNQQQAFNFFISKGLEGYQAAAIVGNLTQESNVDPTDGIGPPPGPSFGIAQWLVNGRWVALVAYATANSLDPKALATQLQFMWIELTSTHSNALAALKATSSVAPTPITITNAFNKSIATNTQLVAGTDQFENTFEAAGIPKYTNREFYAQTVLSQYGGSSTSTGSSAASSPSAGGCNTSTGDNGFVFYTQTDPQWASDLIGPNPNNTLGSVGCGPTSMAMIISTLNSQAVTPHETGAFEASHGLYVPGSGSSWSIGPVMAANWHLQSRSLSPDVAAISAAVQSGALVIAPGTGPPPYSGVGHFVVIRSVTPSGKWLIGNPSGNNQPATEWDPQAMVTSMINNRGGGIYAITK